MSVLIIIAPVHSAPSPARAGINPGAGGHTATSGRFPRTRRGKLALAFQKRRPGTGQEQHKREATTSSGELPTGQLPCYHPFRRPKLTRPCCLRGNHRQTMLWKTNDPDWKGRGKVVTKIAGKLLPNPMKSNRSVSVPTLVGLNVEGGATAGGKPHVMMREPQALADFRSCYPLRPPCYPQGRIDSECRQIAGFRLLKEAPVTNFQQGHPPLARKERGTNTYIWVIDSKGVPYIIEADLQQLEWQLPKHTNLTGDGEAYVGGELWFRNGSFLYVSGGSGRYPPLSERQLEDAVGVFEAFSYEVRSLGWHEQSGPLRHLEEP